MRFLPFPFSMLESLSRFRKGFLVLSPHGGFPTVFPFLEKRTAELDACVLSRAEGGEGDMGPKMTGDPYYEKGLSLLFTFSFLKKSKRSFQSSPRVETFLKESGPFSYDR